MKQKRQYHLPFGWTTIEDSKKLLEKGLDLNTADMSYNWVVCRVVNGNPKEDWLLQPFSPDDNQPHEQLPCWSLGALLELIPKFLMVEWNCTEYYLNVFPNTDGSMCVDYVDNYTDDGLVEFIEDTTIKAVVNMLVWLLENEYIQKCNN